MVKLINNKIIKNKSTNNKSAKNKSTKNKSTNNKSAKNKSTKNKSTKNKQCKNDTKPVNIKGKTFCVGKCPHSGGPILYDPNANNLFCPWHNSRFTSKGVYKSGPANGKNLKIS